MWPAPRKTPIKKGWLSERTLSDCVSFVQSNKEASKRQSPFGLSLSVTLPSNSKCQQEKGKERGRVKTWLSLESCKYERPAVWFSYCEGPSLWVLCYQFSRSTDSRGSCKYPAVAAASHVSAVETPVGCSCLRLSPQPPLQSPLYSSDWLEPRNTRMGPQACPPLRPFPIPRP